MFNYITSNRIRFESEYLPINVIWSKRTSPPTDHYLKKYPRPMNMKFESNQIGTNKWKIFLNVSDAIQTFTEYF